MHIAVGQTDKGSGGSSAGKLHGVGIGAGAARFGGNLIRYFQRPGGLEKTFFHELSHHAHEKVKGKIKTGQDPLQEIVAELSAQALCNLVGKQPNDSTGNSFNYIESYADELGLSPYTACLRVLTDTEKVISLILTGVISDGKEVIHKAA